MHHRFVVVSLMCTSIGLCMCTHFVVQKLQCCFCVCCLPWSCLATLTQFVCVCRPAVCLLYFHVSQWVISALVIAIATMRWHMPPCSLCDWQDCCSGKMQRMLGQVTPLPLPSSSDIQCVTHFFPLLVLFMYNKPPLKKTQQKKTQTYSCVISTILLTERKWPEMIKPTGV